MMLDFIKISLNNLKRRKLRSWLTILGIVIGIATVVSLISLGNGLKSAVNSQFGISSTEVITVQAGGLNYGPPGSGVVDPLTIEDAEAIEKLNNVQRAVGRNIESGRLEFNDKVIFGYATDIPDGDNREFVYEQSDVEIEEGRLLKDGDRRKIVLGNNFYTNKVGLDKRIIPGNNVLIQNEEFEVIGITKKQGSFILDNVVYMNNQDIKDLFDTEDEVGLIAVQVKDKTLIQDTKKDIEKLLRKRRNVDEGEENFEVSTPDTALKTVNKVLTGVQIFIVMIALISILVGTLGIVNTMTTSVLERTKEIGTMKAIGAKNNQIFLIFFVESGFLGLIGGTIGIILGISMGYLGTTLLNNFIGTTTAPTIDYVLILSALLGSFLVGAVSGIAPAIKAAKQNPTEALRG
jgi:putative ABC transport system permease protein